MKKVEGEIDRERDLRDKRLTIVKMEVRGI